VGCNFNDAACKDEVLTTLGVDEVVGTTVTASPTGLTVTVRRYTKGSAPRSAQTTIPTGKPPDAKMNADIGPLFGVAAPPAAKPAAVTATPAKPTPPANAPPAKPTPAATTPPATTPPAKPTPPATAPPVKPAITTTPAPSEPGATTTPPRTADATTEPTANHNARVTQTPPPAEGGNRRLQGYGMATGGVLVVIGFFMWGKAKSIEKEVNAAPANSPADFRHIEDLEKSGDSFAGAGNLFVLVGLAVTGVSAYFYFKHGSGSNTRTARIAPSVFPHGGGVTLTIGGGP
jgi:hypothetical protein